MVAKIKSMNTMNWLTLLAMTAVIGITVFFPEVAFAATTGTVKSKLKSAGTAIQGVLTAIVVIVGVIAALKILVKHMPSIDDPHVKNEMWKSIGNVGYAVGGAAAIIWLLPWVYSLFQ